MSMNSLVVLALLSTTMLPMMVIPGDSVSAQPTGDAWQPLARINPKQPYTIRINNRTGVTVEYASTTNEFSPRRVASGATATLTRLPLPIYLLMSPATATSSLKLTVSANQNTVTVNVEELPEGAAGNTTVNIQQTGGIFVY